MLINGVEANTIDAMDRGLAYGDGLFSTIKVVSGQVQLWEFHLQRLQLGAQKLFFPDIDWQKLTDEVDLVADGLNAIKESVIKVIISRGSGGRGYSADGCISPVRIVSSSVYPNFYHQWQQQGIKLIQCDFQVASNKQLAGLKTLNRLEQVLIKHELQSKQAKEGIVCDDQGYVIEACSANLFIYLDKQWKTPILDKSGVAGVLRRHLMSRALLAGVPISEEHIHVDRLQQAQAMCITNALMGVVPITQYQQTHFNKQSITYCQLLQSLIE